MLQNLDSHSKAEHARNKGISLFEGQLEASRHRPVYRMHRYYARRPGNVMRALVEHYTQPGDVILDPFAGGGSTLVEAFESGRRVVGVDLNPLACFISRCELRPVALDELKSAAAEVQDEFRRAAAWLYETKCSACETDIQANWYEYSRVGTCGEGHRVVLGHAEKVGPGRWRCPICDEPFRPFLPADGERRLVSVSTSCECGHEDVREPLRLDFELEEKLAQTIRGGSFLGANNLPEDEIPQCNMERESALHSKGYRKFRQLFSDRQLISLGALKNLISSAPEEFRQWLLLGFSATLRSANLMVTRNESWRGRRPLEWVGTGFWLPATYLDANLLDEFPRRMKAILRGKKDFPIADMTGGEAVTVRAVLTSDAPTWIVACESSTQLELPDASVDAIVTDPPYGSYVHYADLSNFWSVWLPEIEGMGRIIDDADEAVVARKNFPGAKDVDEYHDRLATVFAECHRVLKPGRPLVMTFHNREPRAWAAVIAALVSAGFDLPPGGVMYQPGIRAYRNTARSRRNGSVTGDFVLTFVKSSARSGEQGPRVVGENPLTDRALLEMMTDILADGPRAPDELFVELYKRVLPDVFTYLQQGDQPDDAIAELLRAADDVALFDSHRRAYLEEHFDHVNGEWSLPGSQRESA